MLRTQAFTSFCATSSWNRTFRPCGNCEWNRVYVGKMRKRRVLIAVAALAVRGKLEKTRYLFGTILVPSADYGGLTTRITY